MQNTKEQVHNKPNRNSKELLFVGNRKSVMKFHKAPICTDPKICDENFIYGHCV